MENKLKVHKPRWLPCDVCGLRIYGYEKRISPCIYCSYDCLALMILANKDGLLHETKTGFDTTNAESKDGRQCNISV